MSRYLWLTAILIVIVLGGAVLATRASPIQPLERLPGGIVDGPGVEDVTDTSAVIVLTTAAPAFCQVNYGMSMQYGQMRRMSMSGPMTDHRILLSGLQPETEYHFRLSAIDARSRVYQSADLTFRTQKASGGAPPGINVASAAAGAKIAGVSSTYGSGFDAANAIDGDFSTEWSSKGDGDRAWIEVELPTAHHITAVGFWTRTMGTSAQIEQFEVVADGKMSLGPFALPDAAGMHYFSVDVTANRLRFNILKSSGGNTGAVELAAIAPP